MKLKHLVFALIPAFLIPTIFSAPGGADGELKAAPAVFDFGWAPSDVKIFADFEIANDSTGTVAVTSVRPTCGCTAADFVPSNLAPGDSLPLRLAFNTRGYTKRSFLKSTAIQNGSGLPTLGVDLRGAVEDPSAVFQPKEAGILNFKKEERDAKKTLLLQNESAEPLSLTVVQKPEAWAGWTLSKTVIPSSGTVRLEVFVSPPFDEKRETSLTFEAKGKSTRHRATVAVRTGDHSRPALRPAQ